MSLPEHQGTPPSPSHVRRIWNAVKRTPRLTRRALTGIDVWVQDHPGIAAAIAVTLFLAGTVVSMRQWGETILELAKTYQPLFTILGIAISAIIAILKAFRHRRAARLAATLHPDTAPAVPPTETAATITTEAAQPSAAASAETPATTAPTDGTSTTQAATVPGPTTSTETGGDRVR
uniref:hypothetical protein n=1 Tax=Streptomyces sp. NBC_00998 TaxID=2903712 RepID=UPI002F90B655|nr:hypothetical protein OG513_39615 [Streptomyces sp. NBC_00998]